MAMVPKASTGYAVRLKPRGWLKLLRIAEIVAEEFGSNTVTLAHVDIASTRIDVRGEE